MRFLEERGFPVPKTVLTRSGEAMTALPEFASLNPRIAEEVKKMFAASDLQSWVTGGNT